MAEKAWYSVRSEGPTRWKVTKVFDSDPRGMKTYDVAESGNSLVCTCFAGHRNTCRHREMIGVFKVNHAIDTGAMYQFDTKTWREPISPDEGGE